MKKFLRALLAQWLILPRKLNPARVVMLGFALIIALGSFLLWLPISSRSGEFTPWLTCFFTATSASCVTGLAKVDTYLYWSPFGQAVILTMIQIGGLGFVSMLSLISFLFHQKFTLSQRLVMASDMNMNDVSSVVKVVRRALVGTVVLELAGAVLLSVVFIPQFGLVKGIWFSLFHSISAFCNGGFDLMGGVTGEFSSVSGYAEHPYVLMVLMILIVAGGLGFFVWEDLMQHKFRVKKVSLYSRLVIHVSTVLVLWGFVIFLALEWNNPDTLGTMPYVHRVSNALFQSVTLRTAGFATIDQAALRDGSVLVALVLMLIGGSSGSTAGGLKTGTVGVLLLTLRQRMKGHEEVVYHKRTIPSIQVINAMILLQMMLLFFFFGSLALAVTDNAAFLPSVYEAASAMGTVGLSMNLTASMNTLSSLVIIALMFLGRVGILSCSIALMTSKRKPDVVKYPKTDMMIG